MALGNEFLSSGAYCLKNRLLLLSDTLIWHSRVHGVEGTGIRLTDMQCTSFNLFFRNKIIKCKSYIKTEECQYQAAACLHRAGSYLKSTRNTSQNRSFLLVNALPRRKLLSTISPFSLEIEEGNFVHFDIIETDLGVNVPIRLQEGKTRTAEGGSQKGKKIHLSHLCW